MTAVKSQTKTERHELAAPSISPSYQDLVIGLVYYAGAIGKNFCADLQTKITKHGYETPDLIKVSRLIEEKNQDQVPAVGEIPKEQGKERLRRVIFLQDLGDEIRGPKQLGGESNPSILASLAIANLIRLRGGPPDESKKCLFIIDSLKHRAEVELLRTVYGHNFRLIAIHCSRDNRFKRLEKEKFHGANHEEIKRFMCRDEQDTSIEYGQEVRKVFHLADFFIDNDHPDDGIKYEPDLARFVGLCVGKEMLRPKVEETGMYHAHASAMRSSCLSRQVGAAILTPNGRVLAIGTNEVPKRNGGVYRDGDAPDNRCFKWNDWCVDRNDQRWTKYYEESPVGKPHCHNTRRKHELRKEIAAWLGENIANPLSEELIKVVFGKEKGLFDTASQQKVEGAIKAFFSGKDLSDDMPGIKDIIEYSRSIHAEMEALMSALRSGTPTTGAVLYSTTYPCHNCARHIVAAGIDKVYYLEPFVKSLALELHHDSIVHDEANDTERVALLPFTGVGPRLYAELFVKEGEWKTSTGQFNPPPRSGLRRAIQLNSLDEVERRAAALADVNQDQ